MKDEAPVDHLGYQDMAQEALRGVIRAALRRAGEPEGLPGDHHFYITFVTRADGVSIPEDLARAYPDEMTIVLQHQFWDLVVSETEFSIVLQFSGQPKKLVVPYAAVTRFYDPSVQFLLQFELPPLAAPSDSPDDTKGTEAPDEASSAAGDGEDGAAKVVSLDTFRKR
ncbi:MAG: SspB family protein [Brevundimonas sp.]|uniref:SspB family protein n=1 Tax=Brevundimonas sp. TaxID=1871086 RepID=UPI00391D627E